jgi:hypothetical protein
MRLIFFISFLLCAQSPGSLYVAGSRLSDAARDLRASQVGDVVTIVVSENLSAVASGVTNTSRKTSATSNINSLFGPANPRLKNLLDVAGNQSLQGQGQTSRNMTLSTTISARVVDQDAPHQLRRYREEVRPVLPRHALQVHQPQVRLVDQRRGLQSVPAALAAHEVAGQAPKLFVNDGRELVERFPVSAAPGLEQDSDVRPGIRPDLRCRHGLSGEL